MPSVEGMAGSCAWRIDDVTGRQAQGKELVRNGADCLVALHQEVVSRAF